MGKIKNNIPFSYFPEEIREMIYHILSNNGISVVGNGHEHISSLFSKEEIEDHMFINNSLFPFTINEINRILSGDFDLFYDRMFKPYTVKTFELSINSKPALINIFEKRNNYLDNSINTSRSPIYMFPRHIKKLAEKEYISQNRQESYNEDNSISLCNNVVKSGFDYGKSSQGWDFWVDLRNGHDINVSEYPIIERIQGINSGFNRYEEYQVFINLKEYIVRIEYE